MNETDDIPVPQTDEEVEEAISADPTIHATTFTPPPEDDPSWVEVGGVNLDLIRQWNWNAVPTLVGRISAIEVQAVEADGAMVEIPVFLFDVGTETVKVSPLDGPGDFLLECHPGDVVMIRRMAQLEDGSYEFRTFKHK